MECGGMKGRERRSIWPTLINMITSHAVRLNNQRRLLDSSQRMQMKKHRSKGDHDCRVLGVGVVPTMCTQTYFRSLNPMLYPELISSYL